MPNDFVSADYLATFSGMVLALGLIVQFTKSLIKSKFSDAGVRMYTFVWANALVATVYWSQGLLDATGGEMAATLITGVVNAIVVTLAAMGGYEVVTDPHARKF